MMIQGALGNMALRIFSLGLLVGATCFGTGCASPHAAAPRPTPPEQFQLRQKSVEALKRAVTYKHAGSVRAQSIEVMQRRIGNDALPWIRNALHDEEPGVQFAAILALGNLRDRASYDKILGFAGDEHVGLQVAACFALHRLGDTTYTGRLPEILLSDPEAENRRSAAFVLGMLGESGAIKVLARAMKDDNPSVTDQALESLAMLENGEAIQQLTFNVSSGMGPQRVAAINALAELKDSGLAGTFRYKLNEGEFVETKLAAARALGMIGSNEGFDFAMQCIAFDSPIVGKDAEPPHIQVRRVRLAATAALGAMRDQRALSALKHELLNADDPRNQVAAADAILQILGSGTGHAFNRFGSNYGSDDSMSRPHGARP